MWSVLDERGWQKLYKWQGIKEVMEGDEGVETQGGLEVNWVLVTSQTWNIGWGLGSMGQ